MYNDENIMDFWDDASEHPADLVEDFSPIAPGEYQVEVSEMDVDAVDTANGTGNCIKAKLTIIGPTHEGRLVWCRFNVQYQAKSSDAESIEKAEKARNIGRADYGKMCRAAGFNSRPRSIQDLVGKVLKVKTGNREYNGKTYTDVKGYAPVDGAPQRPGSSAPSAPAKSARPATSNGVPW